MEEMDCYRISTKNGIDSWAAAHEGLLPVISYQPSPGPIYLIGKGRGESPPGVFYEGGKKQPQLVSGEFTVEKALTYSPLQARHTGSFALPKGKLL